MPKRWVEISESLKDAIARGEFRPGDRLPSETELAARWRVCRMTAHRALDELNRNGLVSRRPRIGTVVLPPRLPVAPPPVTYQVAALFFNLDRHPQAAYLQGFRSALPPDVRLLLCDTGNDAIREAALLREMSEGADALCCYPTCRPEVTAVLQGIIDSGKPVVFVDSVPVGLLGDVVQTDNYGSTRDALRRLCERGHQRVAFVAPPRWNISSVWDRRTAFLDALREHGVPAPESFILNLPRVSGYDLASYSLLVEAELCRLLALPEPPTALFCLEDWMLTVTLDACDRAGLRVPEDIEVCSFSDIPTLEPRILRNVHRIAQNAHRIGTLAAERLMARLQGDKSLPEIQRIPADWMPATVTTDNPPTQTNLTDPKGTSR